MWIVTEPGKKLSRFEIHPPNLQPNPFAHFNHMYFDVFSVKSAMALGHPGTEMHFRDRLKPFSVSMEMKWNSCTCNLVFWTVLIGLLLSTNLLRMLCEIFPLHERLDTANIIFTLNPQLRTFTSSLADWGPLCTWRFGVLDGTRRLPGNAPPKSVQVHWSLDTALN